MIGWSGYRDPAARATAAAGAPRPPLPLTQPDALKRALELRDLGWDYTAISQAMGYYHGHWAPHSTWYGRIRRGTR